MFERNTCYVGTKTSNLTKVYRKKTGLEFSFLDD